MYAGLFSYHALKSKSIEIFCTIIPQDIGSTTWTCCTPVLDFSYFTPATWTTLNTKQQLHYMYIQIQE